MKTKSLVQLTLFHFKGLYREKVAFFFNLIFPLMMVGIFGVLLRPTVGAAVFEFLVPGQMAVMLLSAGMFSVGVGLAQQRRSGALRHLLSTPISLGEWVLARIAANFSMAIVQAIVLFVFAGVVFGVAPPQNLMGTLATLTLCMAVSIAIGLLIGMFVQGESAAVGVAMPIFMLLLLFGNSMMPLENPPAFIATMMRYIPSFHMTAALRAVMMRGDGLGEIVTELLILAGFAAGLLGIALVRMRRQFVVRG